MLLLSQLRYGLALTTGTEAVLVDLLTPRTRTLCNIRDISSRSALEQLTQKDLHTTADLQKILLSDSEIKSMVQEINELSSLYHLAWIFKISQCGTEEGGTTNETRLTFVELASVGKKRCIETPPTTEESAIASGMSALTGVFKFLGKRKYMSQSKKPESAFNHIPWRDSSLTKWLQAYMEHAKVIWILATADGSSKSAEATVGTLNFVSRLRALSLHSKQHTVIRPRWIASCHCNCLKQVSFENEQKQSSVGKRMTSLPTSQRKDQNFGGIDLTKNAPCHTKARLVLHAAVDQDKTLSPHFTHNEEWSTSFGGESAFTELLGILRKNPGSVKGEALLESLFKRSCYLREQVHNEKTRNRRLQAEIEDSTEAIRELEQKNNVFSSTNDALQKELDEMHSRNTITQNRLEEKCAMVQELKDEQKQMRTEHEEALQEERVHGHRSLCKAEEWKKEVDRLKTQVELLSQQVGAETSEKLSFQSKIEMLEREHECSQKKLNCLNNYSKNLESEKNMILKDYQTKANQVESLQASIIKVESLNKNLEKELNETTKERRSHLQSISDLSTLNEELKQQIVSLLSEQERLQSIEEELTKLTMLRANLSCFTNQEPRQSDGSTKYGPDNAWIGLADDLSAGIANMENKLKTNVIRIDKLSVERERFQKERDNVQESLDTAKGQVLAMQAQLNGSLKKIKEVSQDKDQVNSALSAQYELTKKYESEKEQLLLRLKETTQKLMESIETQSLLETKLSASNFNEETLQRHLEEERKITRAIQEEVTELKMKLHDLESALEQSESLRVTLEKKNEHLEECLAQQSIANKDLDDRIERLATETKSLEFERLKSRTDREQSDREIRNLRTKLANLESQHYGLTDENRRLAQQLERMRDEHQHLEKLQRSIQTCIDERDALQRQNKSLNNEIEALLATNKKTKTEKESLIEELSAAENAVRKYKMDALTSVSNGTTSTLFTNKNRLRRSQTEVQKRQLSTGDSLKPRRYLSSLHDITPVEDETISARVSRLASNASDVLEEIGKTIPEPTTAFHRRLYTSISCCANGKPERLQRPTLRARPSVREPQRLGSSLVVVQSPETLEKPLQRDQSLDEDLVDQTPVLQEEEEFFVERSFDEESVSASQSMRNLQRPVMKPRTEEDTITTRSVLQRKPQNDVQNESETLQRPLNRSVSPPASVQDSDVQEKPVLMRPELPKRETSNESLDTESLEEKKEEFVKENGGEEELKKLDTLSKSTPPHPKQPLVKPIPKMKPEEKQSVVEPIVKPESQVQQPLVKPVLKIEPEKEQSVVEPIPDPEPKAEQRPLVKPILNPGPQAKQSSMDPVSKIKPEEEQTSEEPIVQPEPQVQQSLVKPEEKPTLEEPKTNQKPRVMQPLEMLIPKLEQFLVKLVPKLEPKVVQSLVNLMTKLEPKEGQPSAKPKSEMEPQAKQTLVRPVPKSKPQAEQTLVKPVLKLESQMRQTLDKPLPKSEPQAQQTLVRPIKPVKPEPQVEQSVVKLIKPDPKPQMKQSLIKPVTPELEPKDIQLDTSLDSSLLESLRRQSIKDKDLEEEEEQTVVIDADNEQKDDTKEVVVPELTRPMKPTMRVAAKPPVKQPEKPSPPSSSPVEDQLLVVDRESKPVAPRSPESLQRPSFTPQSVDKSTEDRLDDLESVHKEITEAHTNLMRKDASFSNLITEISKGFEIDDSVFDITEPDDTSTQSSTPFDSKPIIESVPKLIKPTLLEKPTPIDLTEEKSEILRLDMDSVKPLDEEDINFSSLESFIETPVDDLLLEIESRETAFDLEASTKGPEFYLDQEIIGENWKSNEDVPDEVPEMIRPTIKEPSQDAVDDTIDSISILEGLTNYRTVTKQNQLRSPVPPREQKLTPSPPETQPVAPEKPTFRETKDEIEELNDELRNAMKRSRGQMSLNSPLQKTSVDRLDTPGRQDIVIPKLDDVIEGLKSPVVEDRAIPELKNKPTMKSASIDADDTVEIDRQFLREKYERAEKAVEQHRLEREERRMKAEDNKQRRLERRGKKISDPVLIEMRRKARHERQEQRQSQQQTTEKELIIEVGAKGMSVTELAELLAVDPTEVIKTLFIKGIMVTVNQTLDMETVKVVANEMEVIVADRDEDDVTDQAKKKTEFLEDDENCISRPPVVTVMGHVDHGKTSLLDYIRHTSVVSGESGGITQAIGAYTCSIQTDSEERLICFLDTPGHEAFSAMRARGAKLTDVAIIIIAADDGIQPQTKEAINHAQAAEVPLIIAINKIDAPGADPERIKRELSEIQLLPEEWGGETPVVCISAKTGEGVKDLLELITLVSDIQLDLRANPNTIAKGTVVEAYLDKRTGVVSTLLVQNGTLNIGDIVLSGGSYGKVRSLSNENGVHVSEAGPSVAVQMLGLNILPSAGDVFQVYESESLARAEAQKAAELIRQQHLAEASGGGSMVTLSSLASVDDEEQVQGLQRINLVLKADTSGSLEAIRGALNKLPQDSVVLRYLHSAAGEVTESDVLLAAAADGMIFGFKVSISEQVSSMAKQKGVELNGYDVIYHLLDDVRAAMEGRLSPTEDRVWIGAAEVKAVFEAGSRKVAGCSVQEGRLDTNAFIQVLRKKDIQFEGFLSSLRRIKEIVNTVEAGLECGVGCDEFSDWQEGDRIEAYLLAEKRTTLEESHAPKALDQEQLQGLTGS
eukprot:g777.t1